MNVTIQDDEVPELTISAGPDVTEGPNASANFTITSDILPYQDFSIQYVPVSNLNGTESYLQTLEMETSYVPTSTTYLPDGKSGVLQLTQPIRFTPVDENDPNNTKATATLEIPLKDDSILEIGGTVKVTLISETAGNENYQVHRINNNATLSVTDDDIPEFKITGRRAAVESIGGSTAEFIVSTEEILNRKFLVFYNLSETGEFIPAETEGTGRSALLDFTNDVTSATLTIDIPNDQNEEDDGTITVTLITDPADANRYTVAPSPDNTTTIPVFDNDTGAKVSVVADNGEVTENSATGMSFNLTMTGVHGDFTWPIYASVSEDGGDFLVDAIEGVGQTFSALFTDPDGDNIYTAVITNPVSNTKFLDNDSKIEPDANVKLTILYNGWYRVGPHPEGVIKILDDDTLPIISIKEDQGSIAENEGPPTFEISATRLYATKFATNKSLEIKATPRDEGGQFIPDLVEHQRPSYQVNFSDPDGDGNSYWGSTTDISAIRER